MFWLFVAVTAVMVASAGIGVVFVVAAFVARSGDDSADPSMFWTVLLNGAARIVLSALVVVAIWTDTPIGIVCAGAGLLVVAQVLQSRLGRRRERSAAGHSTLAG